MPVPLADRPPQTIRPFNGPVDTIAEMRRAAKGPRGEQSALVQSLKNSIVRDLQPKDYLSEILAVRFFVAERVRYSNDAFHVEQVQDPERLADQIIKYGRAVGDCFPEGTLVLGEGHRLIKIEELSVGTKIWGIDHWSKVEGILFKGTLPVTVIRLTNGSQLKLTEDHHVYVLSCPRHGYVSRNCSPAHCPMSERRKERIRVADLVEGMILTTPERLPFGIGEIDPDQAYVEGLFVADGWVDHGEYCSRFSISGQDGCPKENQKRQVQAIADRLGLPSRWHRKYISINDKEWALRMQQMGHHAWNKHILSLDLNESAAAATLRGVMVDSGANTCGLGRTLTTTSRELAVQMRVLHKMFGISCGSSYLDHHGGLGTHPIWRLSTRGKPADRAEKLLRVKHIEREVVAAPCWDIQTDDHHVYLPEYDVTVSQCDDIALLIATLCLQLGREAQYVTVGFHQPGYYTHVFSRVQEPKSQQWIVCDPVAGPDEANMLRRVTTFRIWEI